MGKCQENRPNLNEASSSHQSLPLFFFFTNVKANLVYHTNSEHVLWSPLPLEEKCKIAKRFGNKKFGLHNIGTTKQIDWC